MARTRSKPKAAAKEASPEPAPVSTAKPLPSSTSNPPKVIILPKDASKDSRIVTLDNPATADPSRYFFCPDKGFYEFTRIAAPKKDCKSWLITGETDEKDEAQNEAEQGRIGGGYITKSADLFLATPIDILFLILPALAPKTTKETKQHFLAFDDYLDMLTSSSQHWRSLLSQFPSLKSMIENRMKALCDLVEAGDETMYRISHQKLLNSLLTKAARMVANGLPPSMEEKFVKTALEVPVMSIRREDSTLSAVSIPEDSTATASQDSTAASTSESQTSAKTTLTTPDADLDDAPAPALTTPAEIPHLLRLRTALTYLTSSYIPPSLHTHLTTLLPNTPPSFTPLDTHLAALSKLRSEAAALRSISDNMSRKRAAMDDDEKIAEREEKKRKKEEDEKKKKSEGRAIKQLKKVDTSGMKKMSAFFTKVPKKA